MNNDNSNPEKLNSCYLSFLILLFFSVDQLTKYLVASNVPLESVLFSFWGFGITYKINKGFALHVFEQYEYTILISIIIHIIVTPVVILAYRFYRANYRPSRIIYTSFLLFISGNIGNFCDQIFLGNVRDFILWPGPGTPNFADIFIGISVIYLFIELLKNPKIDNKSLFNLKSTKNDLILLKKFFEFSKNEVKLIFKNIE